MHGDLHLPPSFKATTRSAPTRPDHILVSNSLWDKMRSTEVLPDLRGSDHYPLKACAEFGDMEIAVEQDEGLPRYRILWDATKRQAYALKLEEMGVQLQACQTLIEANQNEEALNLFVHILKTAAREVGMREQLPQGTTTRVVTHKPFYDRQCGQLKREWRRQGKRHGFRAPEVLTLQRAYHSHVRACKRRWMLTQLEESITLFRNNPKQFWKKLRGKQASLPRPLQSPKMWQEFMNRLAPWAWEQTR